jgi:hypothetical protein
LFDAFLLSFLGKLMKVLLPKPGNCLFGNDELTNGNCDGNVILPPTTRRAHFFGYNSAFSKTKPLHGHAANHTKGIPPATGRVLVGVELPKLASVLLIKRVTPVCQRLVAAAQPLRASAHSLSACLVSLGSTLLCSLSSLVT